MILVATLAGCPGACPPPKPAPLEVLTTPAFNPTTGNIVVSFPSASGSKKLLLYSGVRDGACRRFEQYVATSDVLLKSIAFDATCPAEIDLFAAGKNAIALAVDPANPGSELWFTAALASGTLSLQLDSPTRLPVRLWLVGDDNDLGEAQAMRDRLLDKAYPVLESMGTGLTLDTATALLKTGVIVPDCAAADLIAAGTVGYDPTRLNVYFVEKYGSSFSTPAMNCVQKDHREIIFIAWGNPWVSDPILAHELGHSLGLIRPIAKWGHTFAVTPDFANGNFMWEGPDIDDISVGQVYAMNFSIDSWLNTSGSAFARPVIRTCPDSWSLVGQCPALNAFAAGWPP